ncbi:N-acetylglucosamine-6-phosphate deacetylase [Clostridium sp. chh4-2]|uniref:N-acetylglucosamine-6-phosphate deacetylase n=1 Tax=Clostridium sp. chh4-2 TaxID=2067550 RepID=UPI000CCF7E3D|nr:N-acetylglucosamine-6-phosphate deacetylase [Clostridium sp. chh4-2]PNV63901.1 N-acetylglucosamine-6-phosphate deacetylase [Clostridium sp. chh4-2]
MIYCFQNAMVVSPFSQYSGCVLVDEGKIIEVAPSIQAPEGAMVIDAGGRILCPGFVDLHVHGGGGSQALEGTEDAIITMANAHLVYGTTTLLPTIECAPAGQMNKAALGVKQAMRSARSKATIAGIHLEGPYLSPRQAGAQQPGAIMSPSEGSWQWMLELAEDIRMVGIAPELEGAFALSDALTARGVAVSIAHSDASEEHVRQAVVHGFCDVTHLYSACSTFKRVKGFRIPGVVETALVMDELSTQIIADGCHLPHTMIQLAYRLKGADRVELITDAQRFAGWKVKEGEVVYAGGTAMIYKDGVMKLPDESAFAGSVATTDRLLRTVVDAGIPLKDGVRMLTDTPAHRIGLKNKGRIQAGFDADLLILDDNFFPVFIMAKGNIVRDGL